MIGEHHRGRLQMCLWVVNVTELLTGAVDLQPNIEYDESKFMLTCPIIFGLLKMNG